MDELKLKIENLSNQWFNDTVAIRRHLHANPELSYEEYNTAKYITAKLTEWGIPHKEIANTGVLAIIKSDHNFERKVIALRSDHDALPIIEQNDIPFKSKHEGKAHMCGHDAHTACNLTAARILWALRNEMEGTVKLLFQPAEEVVLPDGTTGAKMMIKDGALQNPKPSFIIAQHVNPAIPTGKIALKEGNIMASVDTIKIKIRGKGGHAALPHLCIDPVVTASQIVISLQQVVSRLANPFEPTVLSIGKISGGSAFNIIPDEVELLGTLRAYNEEWRSEAHKQIIHISQSIANAYSAKAECIIEQGVPCLPNDIELTKKIKAAAINYLGEPNVLYIDASMTGEDFAIYAQQMPSCFYWLGVRNEDLGYTSGLHTNTMNIDESSLKIGSGLFAYLAMTELSVKYK